MRQKSACPGGPGLWRVDFRLMDGPNDSFIRPPGAPGVQMSESTIWGFEGGFAIFPADRSANWSLDRPASFCPLGSPARPIMTSELPARVHANKRELSECRVGLTKLAGFLPLPLCGQRLRCRIHDPKARVLFVNAG